MTAFISSAGKGFAANENRYCLIDYIYIDYIRIDITAIPFWLFRYNRKGIKIDKNNIAEDFLF